MLEPEPLQKRGPAPTWTKTSTLPVIRAFEAHCQQAQTKPTYAYYNRWKQGRDAPSGFTVERVFGTWNNARRQASQDPACLRLSRKDFTQAECLEALRAYYRSCGKIPTFRDYGIWRRGALARPSSHTIHDVVGWANAVHLALGHDVASR